MSLPATPLAMSCLHDDGFHSSIPSTIWYSHGSCETIAPPERSVADHYCPVRRGASATIASHPQRGVEKATLSPTSAISNSGAPHAADTRIDRAASTGHRPPSVDSWPVRSSRPRSGAHRLPPVPPKQVPFSLSYLLLDAQRAVDPMPEPEHHYGTFTPSEPGVSSNVSSSAATAVLSGALERTDSTTSSTLATTNTKTHLEESRSLDSEIASTRSMASGGDGSAQAGVKRTEAIASTWTKTSLYIAYLGIALTAWATSLEGLTTVNLTIYATSAFKAHSLVSTVMVVQGVVLSVVKPPMSKIADVFGRFEAFNLSVFLFIIGYAQQAASDSVNTYAAAQIFYSAGQTGLQILIQIFIADTSDLLNRALLVTLPDVPFLVNVWIGPPLADRILTDLNWRWGYGMWAVILPIAFTPLALTLFLTQRKAAKHGLLPPSVFQGQSAWKIACSLWYELDFFGLVLLCAGFSLILIPLTLGAHGNWSDPGLIAMLLLGGVCLVVFPFWERSKTLAPRAFFPRGLFKNRMALAGLAYAFFYFMAFYLSVYPYFQSYLLVVHDMSVTEAGHVVQIFTFAATVTSILVSLGIKYTKRYRIFVTGGACIYLTGLVLMLFFRTQESSIRTITFAQLLVGIGGGMSHGPAQLGVQASASHAEVAAATAGFLTLLEIGGAVGSAISGAIWSANILPKLEAYLPPETLDRAQDIYGNVSMAATGWPMGSPTRDAINLAYQETMTKILIMAVIMATPCIFISLLMKDYKLDEIDQHVKGVVIGGSQNLAGHDESTSWNAPTTRLLSRNDQADEEEDGHDGDLEVRQSTLVTPASHERLRQRYSGV
nr:siderophore iron transporter mirc [Quercus suber]